jgi:mannose-6-phosphate isomerase-like protein (cupin superfamily)
VSAPVATPRRVKGRLTRVEKPWGWELWWAHTERYVGKILHINRGAALSYQFHRKKDETIYVLHGELALEFAPGGGRVSRRRLRPGEALRIRPGDHHRMTAITACDVLEASTPEVDDVVRLEDRYGRANTNGVGRSSASRGATTSKRRTGARRERRS